MEAGVRAATLLTLLSTAVRNDLDVWAYLKDVLDRMLAGSADYESLRADVWKRFHPEAVRQCRVDERRDQADREQFRRTQRRLSNLRDVPEPPPPRHRSPIIDASRRCPSVPLSLSTHPPRLDCARPMSRACDCTGPRLAQPDRACAATWDCCTVTKFAAIWMKERRAPWVGCA